jgi:hypothetical protein
MVVGLGAWGPGGLGAWGPGGSALGKAGVCGVGRVWAWAWGLGRVWAWAWGRGRIWARDLWALGNGGWLEVTFEPGILGSSKPFRGSWALAGMLGGVEAARCDNPDSRARECAF